MSSLPKNSSGVAAGVITAVRTFAIVFGIAFSGVIYKQFEMHGFNLLLHTKSFDHLLDFRTEILGLLEGYQGAIAKLSQYPADLQASIHQIYALASTNGFIAVMIFWLALSALGIFASLRLQSTDKTPS
jgi:hypothetical protein